MGPKLAGAMDTLDKAAAHGVDNLTNALPSLRFEDFNILRERRGGVVIIVSRTLFKLFIAL